LLFLFLVCICFYFYFPCSYLLNHSTILSVIMLSSHKSQFTTFYFLHGVCTTYALFYSPSILLKLLSIFRCSSFQVLFFFNPFTTAFEHAEDFSRCLLLNLFGGSWFTRPCSASQFASHGSFNLMIIMYNVFFFVFLLIYHNYFNS
jgi:hypothetical protein